MVNFSKKYWQWVILLFLAFIWGTSFILMKKGLRSYSNYQVAAFRMFFSFVILIPLILKHYKKLTKENFKSILIVGFIGNGIPAILFTTAQTQITSSLAGVLNSLTPLFTIIIGILFYKAKSKWYKLLGVIIGLAGASGLVLYGKSNITNGNNWYAVFVVIATLCYGTSVNEIKARLSKLNGIEITSLAFLLVGPFAGLYLLFSDFSVALNTPHYIQNLGFVFILALFSSVIAVIIFNHLIQYTTTLFAASVTYVIPIFAVMWGLFDGETINFIQLVWIVTILLGVYLVNKT
ncbi:MAG: EamA family transporter [Chlorobi bacterium]|nr:EamA family transporter [Chlorobiota bacterium]